MASTPPARPERTAIRPHPTDWRAKLLQLTPEGNAQRVRLLEALGQVSPLTKLSPLDRSTLSDLLRRVAEPS